MILRGRRLIFLFLILIGSAAEADRRWSVLIDPRPLTSESLGDGFVRFRAPRLHHKGSLHYALYRRLDSEPSLIKVLRRCRADRTDQVCLDNARSQVEGILLGEELGGPKLKRIGLFKGHDWRAPYVEMEYLFPGEASFTKKGWGSTWSFTRRRSILRTHLPALARLIRRALESDIVIKDLDFIMTPGAIRLIDTGQWTRDPTAKIYWLMSSPKNFVAWIESRSGVCAHEFRAALEAEITSSKVWPAERRSRLIHELNRPDEETVEASAGAVRRWCADRLMSPARVPDLPQD